VSDLVDVHRSDRHLETVFHQDPGQPNTTATRRQRQRFAFHLRQLSDFPVSLCIIVRPEYAPLYQSWYCERCSCLRTDPYVSCVNTISRQIGQGLIIILDHSSRVLVLHRRTQSVVFEAETERVNCPVTLVPVTDCSRRIFHAANIRTAYLSIRTRQAT
jgi:hypothetical protein